MRIKRLISTVLILLMAAACLSAAAEVKYYTNIQVNVVALDNPTPSPVPTAEPTSTATPEPTPEPILVSTPTPEPTKTPEPTATPEPTPTPEPIAYEIDVDLVNQVVTVYREGNRTQAGIARQMICSSGTGTNTPLGTFIMPEVSKVDEREEWYYIGKYRLYVQYASRIDGPILFHSLPSEQRGATPTQDSTEALGSRASHGCIRLRPADSRWIAENCMPGTEVNIFEGGAPDEALRELLLASSFVSEEMSYADFLNGEKVYSISSNSPEVQYMQAKLAELGYLLGESDGAFGAETHAAVVDWQLENDYTPNGEMNEEQLSVLLRQTPVPGAVVNRGKPARVKVKDGLILRSEPNSKSRQLDVLRNDTIVRVLDETRGWYKIRVGTLTGYAAAKYIEITENDAEVN